MKKLLFVVVAMFFVLVACQKEENDSQSGAQGSQGGNVTHVSNSKKILGEWKATKIEATINGEIVLFDSYEELADQLEGKEWITVTEKNIRLMDTKYEMLLPYELSGNKLVFQGGESASTYELVSVSDSDLIIKYSNGRWTSNIYYKKIK